VESPNRPLRRGRAMPYSGSTPATARGGMYAPARTAAHSVRLLAASSVATLCGALGVGISRPGRIDGGRAGTRAVVGRIEACPAGSSREPGPPRALQEISVRRPAPRDHAPRGDSGTHGYAASGADPAPERTGLYGRFHKPVEGNSAPLEDRAPYRPCHGAPPDRPGRPSGEGKASGPAREGSSADRRSSGPPER
jgi:hypothetical protein